MFWKTSGERLAIGDLDVNYQEAFEEDKLSELPPPRYNQKYFGHTQICLTPEKWSLIAFLVSTQFWNYLSDW